MNCENCPFLGNCKIEYFNGLPVCTAFFNNRNWQSSNHTNLNDVLGRQCNTSSNTSESCRDINHEP